MIKKNKISAAIEQLVLPYKDIFTSVFLIRTKDGALLFDTASSAADAENHIFPWLEDLGVTAEELRYIFISHNHRDHAGGLLQITAAYPDAMIVSGSPDLKDIYWDSVICPADGDRLLKTLRVVTIPGHTPDSMALLDTQSGILLTGDCLQLYGIFGSGEWGANITLPAAHMKALKRLEKLNISKMVFAHNYHPMGQLAEGREAVTAALKACREPLMQIRTLIQEYPQWQDRQVQQQYQADAERPKVSLAVIAAMRKAMRERKI